MARKRKLSPEQRAELARVFRELKQDLASLRELLECAEVRARAAREREERRRALARRLFPPLRLLDR